MLIYLQYKKSNIYQEYQKIFAIVFYLQILQIKVYIFCN